MLLTEKPFNFSFFPAKQAAFCLLTANIVSPACLPVS